MYKSTPSKVVLNPLGTRTKPVVGVRRVRVPANLGHRYVRWNSRLLNLRTTLGLAVS